MAAIYKRELKAFFCSVIGWLYLAVMMAVMGIYFYLLNLLVGYPTISYMLQSVAFLIVFTIPILTMRSLAEERKYKTDQLILTAPISVGKIVMGKYLALVTLFAIPLVLFGITPPILRSVGRFQLGLSYTSLLGFLLYGCLGLAIGLLASSLTESVVVSAILTLVFMFAGYIMSGFSGIISAYGTTGFSDFVVKILNCFDMVGRFDILSSGYFEVGAVVYYITFTGFVLFCVTQSIQKRRYAFAGRGIKIGAYSIFNILVAAVLTILVNIGLNYIPEQYTSFDVTVNKIFTLTEDTIQYVENLSQDVTIYVLADENSKDGDVDLMLKNLQGYSEHIQVEYVSPIANPMFYYNYTSAQPSENSLIVVSGNESMVIDYYDLYVFQTDYTTYESEVVGSDIEGQLVSAIMSVTADDTPKFYMLLGHNELVFDEKFESALVKENIDYEYIQLNTMDEIPGDADAIVINAPISDYSEDEVDKVLSYLDNGGNAFIIPTWTEESMNNFEQILEYYGVSLVDGVIVEADRSRYYQTPYNLFPNIIYGDITQAIYDGTVLAPLSRGLSYDEYSEDIWYIPFLTTSEDAFSKTDMLSLQDFHKGSQDIDGPFVIGMKIEKPAQNGAISQAVIVATEQMFAEDTDNVVPGYNVKLFGGIVASLAEREISVTVPIKYYEIGNLAFSAETVKVASRIILVIVVACIVLAVFIPLRRRHK
ncbi:MAG: Gldg family protein [Lachnospiraceae bacterium]|nr:Gldg family protein [Lachnospiraceae bacterium]